MPYKKYLKSKNKLKLYDPKYGDEDHLNFNNKPFEELALSEVLTSFTIIQREHYWEGSYDSTFECSDTILEIGELFHYLKIIQNRCIKYCWNIFLKMKNTKVNVKISNAVTAHNCEGREL